MKIYTWIEIVSGVVPREIVTIFTADSENEGERTLFDLESRIQIF